MRLFNKRHYIHLPAAPAELKQRQSQVPDGLWQRCPYCHESVYYRDLGAFKVCPNCQYGFRLTAQQRLDQLTHQFQPWDTDLTAQDPLHFPGYQTKLAQVQHKTGLQESVVTGKARLGHYPVALGVMDTHFFMGSLGSATGEKITRLFEKATAQRLPVILLTASGGARMQEGIHSLMQMAKVSQAVAAHHAAGLLYIVVLTDPTTGGVTASFAMEGDLILAEPHALVGFAGQRVVAQTTQQPLPPDFQRAETVLQTGFIDRIVPRPQLAQTLRQLLAWHQPKVGE